MKKPLKLMKLEDDLQEIANKHMDRAKREAVCPRCFKDYDAKRPAISRKDNKTKICSACGTVEALYDFLANRKG